jgi:hypothetical protein
MINQARKPQDGSDGRKKPFAIRVVRLLTRAAIATELGPEVCWLLTVLVHTQDARFYAGPVGYWNENLASICGFASVNRLIRTRQKAIDAGWLRYEPGKKGRAGTYAVQIPEELQHIPDGATDEPQFFPSKTEEENEIPSEFPSKMTEQTEKNPKGTARESGKHSTYTYTDTHSSCSELSSTKASKPNKLPAEGIKPFPTVGPVKEWILPATKLAEWSEAYPDLDVLAEMRKARQWCVDNPTRRKTARGMTKFLNGWLGNFQNTNRGTRRTSASSTQRRYKPLSMEMP